MSSAMIYIIITIFVYLIGMLLIGFYFNKNSENEDSNEFFLGGRKLGPIVTAMSAEASDMSSWLLMGLPGLAYFSGISEPFWTSIGLAIGTYLNFLLVARRIRVYSRYLGAITIPEFFSLRYRDKNNILSSMAAIIILIFFVPYTASGFKAIGTLFNSLFGVNYHMAMILGAVIIIGYTVLGGFMAVSITDLVQSIIMTLALIILVPFGIKQAGEIKIILANAQKLPGYLNLGQKYNLIKNQAINYKKLDIISILAWGLGYFGMPHILLRFMAIKDTKKLILSRRIASIWAIISMSIAILIGVIGYSISINKKINFLLTISEAETIIIKLANLLSNQGAFFAIISGLVLAGILACVMSTADSQLLAAASSVSQDLLKNSLGIKINKKNTMRVARLTVIFIALIALFLAWDPNNSVFRVVSFAWAGFGAAFGPAILLALFWKRSNKWGILAGMLSGGGMVFVWKYLIAPIGGEVFAIYELLPAFVISLAVIIIVSILTPAPERLILDDFAEFKKNLSTE